MPNFRCLACSKTVERAEGEPLPVGDERCSHEWERCPVHGRTFEEWKDEVDQCLVRLVTMSSDEMPDVDYRAMYEAGDTPEEAAEAALHYAEGN